MPKVSICIPTYNNVESLQRCIESILVQTFEDYEIIITDDSNNSDIAEYVNKIESKKFSTIKIKHNLVHQKTGMKELENQQQIL